MDGIFGVGLAEMLIIGLALFVIGGPKNTAKWAREMGKMVRQVRQAWAQMMADLEHDLGPEGKELMDAARELSQGAREVTSMNNPKQLVNKTMRMVESSLDIEANLNEPTASPEKKSTVTASEESAPSNNGQGKKYTAWLPPDQE